MSAKAIRAILTGLTGLLSATGILPESLADPVAENAEAVLGGVLMLWSIFTVERIRAEKKGATKGAS